MHLKRSEKDLMQFFDTVKFVWNISRNSMVRERVFNAKHQIKFSDTNSEEEIFSF